MGTLFQDLRYAVRMLAQRPGFTAVALLTLALGIGANTAIFSVVNGVLLRPLPFPEPQRLMQCYWQWPKGEGMTVTATQYTFWKEQSRSFEEAAAYDTTTSGFNLAGGAEPLRVRGMRASEGLFRVLGAGPLMGRGFTPEEDLPDGPRVAIISDGLWRRYLGADPNVIGGQVQLNGGSCTIVGVLPPDFQFGSAPELIVPLQLKPNPKDQGHNTNMIARLKAGVTREQAQAEMDQLLDGFRAEFPNHINKAERGIKLVPYQEHVVGDVSKLLLPLFAAVSFVLLIACSNVANLLLARSLARKGEMAIRVAMGAGRRRLVRQLMTENVLLALLGGAAGLLVAMWSLPALLAISPQGLPRLGEIGVDRHAILYAVAASVVTSVLFGVAPAIRATRLDINESLKASSGRQAGGRLDALMRGLLVVTEVALAFVLLIGAGLLIKSFVKLHQVELGFDPNNLMTMQVSLTSDRYKSNAEVWDFQQQVLARVSALPGVRAAATVPSLPMERGLNYYINIEGRQEPLGRSVEMRAISPDYFRTMGIGVRRGRAFTQADARDSAPVVIINETLAKLFWSDREPLGDQVSLGGVKPQVVGVVSDVKEMGLDQPAAPTVYVPAPQVPDGLTRSMNRWFLTSWLVRTEGPVDLSAALRNAIKEVDPQMPVARIRPMTDVVSGSISSQHFLMMLMGSFAGLALILTAVGIYGVLSYQVRQRTREIGIRMALGAQSRDVLRLVIRQGMALTLAGVTIGLVASFILTRVMGSFIPDLLFGVSATDPATFAIISLILTGVALVACFVPARRATKVDPMVALRYE
jgi:putative ABC transport system permease protein